MTTTPTATTRSATARSVSARSASATPVPQPRTATVVLADERLTDGLVDLRWHLPLLLAGGADTVEIDISRVERLSSIGIASLLWARRQCAVRRVDLKIVGASRHTTDQFARTGLTSLLDVCDSTPGGQR